MVYAAYRTEIYSSVIASSIISSPSPSKSSNPAALPGFFSGSTKFSDLTILGDQSSNAL